MVGIKANSVSSDFCHEFYQGLKKITKTRIRNIVISKNNESGIIIIIFSYLKRYGSTSTCLLESWEAMIILEKS